MILSFHCLQQFDNVVGILLNTHVNQYEFFIDIQDEVLFDLVHLSNAKEKRATTYKGLNVAVKFAVFELLGQMAYNLFNQLGFSSRPFQEWLRLGCEKLHKRLSASVSYG
jgi:hypothetical protein